MTGTAGANIASDLDPCAGRERCKIVKSWDAGTDSLGQHIQVIETRVISPPDTDPMVVCGARLSPPGGQEFWRIITGTDGKPQLDPQALMTICNDGYGAAGVGQDRVTIANNTIRHIQSGGSADKWMRDETYMLSPVHLTRWGRCDTYNASGGSYGELGTTEPFMIHAWNIPGDINAPVPKDPTCPDTSNPATANNMLLPVVTLDGDIPNGTTLGSCSMEVTPATGYSLLSSPGQASFKVVATDTSGLLIQIYDPTPVTTPAKSWVKDDHVEVWVLDPEIQDDRGFWQLGILTRDGTIKTGYGKPASLPRVKRWTATDDQGRPVTILYLQWSGPTSLTGQAGTAQVAVLYSDSETGTSQDHLLGTSRVKYADSMSLGGTSFMPLACAAMKGKLDVDRHDTPFVSPLP